MTIFFYLARTFLKTFLMILCFVLALIIIVDGIDQYGIVKGYGATVAQCIIFVIIRIPTNLYQFLPLVILVSALNFFITLSKHSELVALRASGISANRIVFVPILMTIFIGLFATTVFDPILVGSRSMTENYLDSFKGRPSQIVRTLKNGIWLRESINDTTRFVHIPKVNWKKQQLQNVEMFIKSSDDQIVDILAKRAVIEDGKWVLYQPEIYPMDTAGLTIADGVLRLDTQLTFGSIFSNLSDPKRILLKDLPAFITNLERDGYDIKNSKTYYYSERFSPLFLALMALIGSVFALAPLRGGGTGLRSVAAISTGFLFFGVTKLTESMAKAGDIPIIAGVALIPIAGILLAISLLLHQEDG